MTPPAESPPHGDHDDDLEAELRRLFADDRLDVPSDADATRRAVAGARRLRKLRAAYAGTLTVVVLAAVTLTAVLLPPRLSGGLPHAGESTAHPAASGAGQSSTGRRSALSTANPAPGSVPTLPGTGSSPPTSPRVPTPFRLDGGGYGPLRLGMPLKEVLDTGMLAPTSAEYTPPSGSHTCQKFGSVGPLVRLRVVISDDPNVGIVRITSDEASTPEGVHAGTSVKRLRRVYPHLQRGSATYTVRTDLGNRYVFFVANGKVTAVQVAGEQSPC